MSTRRLFPLDHLWNQAFTRMAGAPARTGNRIDLLRDATENYPAWQEAIASAQAWIHFESYIIHDDAIGHEFADALEAKARSGVSVRLLYDWWGARTLRVNRLWRSLRAAGVDVRCFNPPRLDDPVASLSRDHRKMLGVDGRVAFVTGLCIGHDWAGDPRIGLEPWRDTGVRIEGPAVADVERAFADTWTAAGPPLPLQEIPNVSAPIPGSSVTLRVIAGTPRLGNLYRLDQLIAAAAQRSLWLTDAYFIATTPYVQALRAAALDASMFVCSFRTAAIFPCCGPYRAPGTVRSSKQACVSSNGTARCCTRRALSRTDDGAVSGRPISTRRAGWATGSSMSP
jgi:cardiolipin synthase A/B